ncbi:MAG: AsmA family protein [Alphaproteobacteria bacterium]|nr:AsmA family protein [Alphaproteobacteria bacterium]
MKRVRLFLFGVLTVVVVGIIGFGLISLFFDLNRFKPLLVEAALQETGRNLVIDGDIELSLFPRPRATATSIRLSNVPGGSEVDAITVEIASVQVAWFPLLTGAIDIKSVHAKGVRVLVEEGADGQSSLAFQPQAKDGGGGQPSLPNLIEVRDVSLTFRTGPTDNVVDVSRLSLRPQGSAGPTNIDLNLVLNDERVSISGQVGNLLAISEPASFPIALTANTARSTLNLEGSLSDLGQVPSLDLSVRGEGPSISDMSRVVGVQLPNSEPFVFATRLSGPFENIQAADVVFEAGSTRLLGDASLDLTAQRPRITARIHSPGVDLLMTLDDATAEPAPRDRSAAETNQSTVSSEPLPFGFSRGFDADVAFAADTVQAVGLTFTDASLTFRTVGGLMEIERLAAKLPEGSLIASGTLDTRTDEAILSVAADVTGLDVAKVLDTFNVPGNSTRRADAHLELASRGDTPRGLVDNLTAAVRLNELEVSFKDAARLVLTNASAQFDGRDQPINITARGSFRDEPVDIVGRLDPLASYRPGAPYTFQLIANGGGAVAEVRVDMRAAMVDGLTLHTAISGQNLADVSKLVELPMPVAGPYSAAGILVFSDDAITLREADIHVSDSDLKGDLTLAFGGDRTKLVGNLRAEMIDLALLGFGAGPDRAVAVAADETDEQRARQSVGGILNETPLNLRPFLVIDTEVSLTAGLVKAGDVLLRDVTTEVTSDREEMRLDRFSARLDGETLSASGTARQASEEIQVSLKVDVAGIDAAMWVEAMGLAERIDAGDLNLSSDLSSVGMTSRALFDNAVGEVVARRLRFAIKTDDLAAHEKIVLDSLRIATKGANSPVTMQANGTLGDESLTIEASLAPLAELRGLKPVQLEASMTTPSSHVRVRGVAPDRSRPQDLDFTVSAEGRIVREIAYAAGLNLDAAGPWRIQGALTTNNSSTELKEFAVAIGQSDLTGNVRMEDGDDGKRLRIRAVSENFDLADFIRIDADDPGQEPAADAPDGPLFSTTPINFEPLRTLNLDIGVELKAFSGRSMRGRDFTVTVAADNGVVDVHRFSATVGDKPVVGNAQLDLRGDKAKLSVSLSGGPFDAGAVALELSRSNLGNVLQLPVEVGIEVTSTGTSAHELASLMSGTVSLTGGKGFIQQRSFRFLDQGLLRQLAPWDDEKRDRTQINCFVGRFDVKQGVATSRALLLDAEFISIAGKGSIDLGRETLNLTLTPRPKEVRLLDLAVPVAVTGPFAKPKVVPTAGGTAKKVATTLGIFVNPLVLLVPVIEGVTAEKNPCLAAIERADSGDVSDGQNGAVGGVIRGIGEGIGGVGRGIGRVLGGGKE